ncbi:MAG: winged helix-turn-helix domain-containing protein [Chloroflexi bacterium]|nr:winged helix-turn-helix domain-containing protein [Chloroflexota bacterium]
MLDEVVARMPGAVLAVDDDMRVLAWNQAVEKDFRLPATDISGWPCYEVVSLVDTATGLACWDECPLARGSAQPGWAHTRVLKLSGSDRKRALLDHLLLRCLTPGNGPSNLCFLQPANDPTMQSESKVLQAIEAVYPVATSGTDLKEALTVALQAVLRATSAEGGEVFLLDPETQEPALRETQGLPAGTMESFHTSLVGGSFPGIIAHSRLPLLAVGAWPGGETGAESGAYLCAPLVAEGRVLGALGIASRDEGFDVATATRVLFAVAAQLGTYLRWAYVALGKEWRAAGEESDTQTARLRVYCLGPFRVVLDEQPIPLNRFHRWKAVSLLKFLVAHRGRPVPREALMEVLWPEADPDRASANLRVVLHALRRGLEPGLGRGEASSFVVSQGDLVYLEPSDIVWTDSEEFVQRSRRAASLVSQGNSKEALAECGKAAALYQGEYIEDEPFSDWCLFERERLKEVYVDLMKQMGSLLSEKGELDQAIECCRAALGVDHGREEVHRDLMLLLWNAGRRDEALRQFDACRRILLEELAVEPTPETEALHRSILAA